MNKIKEIIDNIKNGVPQALARFNDGEMTGIIKVGSVVARGDQKVNKDLSNKLKEALSHEQERYWIGIPCEYCFPKLYKKSLEYINKDYKYLTKAVVTTNRNWKYFIENFKEAMDGNGSRLIWVSGRDQDLNGLRKKTGISIYSNVELPVKNAWKEYKYIKDIYKDFKKGDTVILSCGPMSRVLAKEWFEKRPDCTFLDVGSAFDPFTRNVWHRCHKGNLPKCKGCN